MAFLKQRLTFPRGVYRLICFMAVFGIGITSGILWERRHSFETETQPIAAASLRDQLLGRWVLARDKKLMEFYPDGTIDENNNPYGMYKWLDSERIEISFRKDRSFQYHIIIRDDKLTMLDEDDGEIVRGKRQVEETLLTKPALREQLLGRWYIGAAYRPLQFFTDGTFDNGDKLSNSYQSCLYTWLDDDHAELALPKSEKSRVRIIIQDDRLTMIDEHGEVTRGIR